MSAYMSGEVIYWKSFDQNPSVQIRNSKIGIYKKV